MNEVPEGQHVRLSSNVYIHGAHSTHMYNPTTTNQHTQAHVPMSFLPVQFPACVVYGESLCLSLRSSVPIGNTETVPAFPTVTCEESVDTGGKQLHISVFSTEAPYCTL